MGRLGPDRRRGRPGRPARPGPQARTSPTAPARAAGTRAGDVASSSARAAWPPGRERGPRSVPGRLIPTVVLSTRPDSARLSAEPPGAQPQRPPDGSGTFVRSLRRDAGFHRLQNRSHSLSGRDWSSWRCAREVVKSSVSLVARSHRLPEVTGEPKGSPATFRVVTGDSPWA